MKTSHRNANAYSHHRLSTLRIIYWFAVVQFAFFGCTVFSVCLVQYIIVFRNVWFVQYTSFLLLVFQYCEFNFQMHNAEQAPVQ